MQLTFASRSETALLLLQRSISFRTESRPLTPAPLRPRTKASSFPRRRNSQCWSDTVESHDLTVKEIKRQEVSGDGRFLKTKPPSGAFIITRHTLGGMWPTVQGRGHNVGDKCLLLISLK